MKTINNLTFWSKLNHNVLKSQMSPSYIIIFFLAYYFSYLFNKYIKNGVIYKINFLDERIK